MDPTPYQTPNHDEASIFDAEHRALTLIAIATVALVAFETLSLATIAPIIAQDLDSLELFGWIFSAFLLPQLVGAVVGGQLADRYGPRRPFLVSLAGFGVGLLLSGVAPTMLALLVGRVVQGLCAGVLVTVIYVCVTVGFADALRPRVMAGLSGAWVLPALLGPAFAGFIADTLSWRLIFYGLLPLIVVVAVVAVRRLEPHRATTAKDTAGDTRANTGEDTARDTARNTAGDTDDASSDLPDADARNTATRGRRDLRASVQLALAAGLALAGFSLTPWWHAVTAFVVGVVSMLPALRHLLPRGTLLASAGLPATIASRGLFVAAYIGTEVLMALIVTSVQGYDAKVAGVLIAAGSIGWSVGAWLQARVDRQYGARTRRARMISGAALVTLGLSIIILVVLLPDAPLWLTLLGWVTAALGIGSAHSTSSVLAFEHAHSGREGKVSSSLQITDQLMQAIAAGTGGALVAFGTASALGLEIGLVMALGVNLVFGLLGVASALRIGGAQPVSDAAPSSS